MSDKDEIIAAIREGFAGVGNNTNYSRQPQGGSSASALAGASVATGDLTGKMLFFAATLAKGGLSTVLLAEGFMKLASAGQQLVDNWRLATDTGLSFGSNIVGYNAALIRAQLTQQDLDKIYKTAGVNLMNFGAGMEAGTRDFLRLSHEYQSSTVIDQIRSLGFNTAQANELMALQVAGANTYNNRKRLSDEEIFRRTQDMAKEFAAVTDASGLSRRKQLEILQKQQENEKLQLAYDRLGGNAAEGFQRLSGDIGSRGLQDLTVSVLTGNITAKVGEQLSFLGEPGQRFKAAVENYAEVLKTNSAKSEVAIAAEKEARQALTAVTDYTRREDIRKIAEKEEMFTEAGSNVGKIALEFTTANRALRANARPGETLDETTARLKEDRKPFIPDPKAEEAQQKLSAGMLKVGRIADAMEINSATALLTAANLAGGMLVRLGNGGDVFEGLNARNSKGEAGAFTPKAVEEQGNKLASAVGNLYDQIASKLPENLGRNVEKMTEVTSEWMQKIWKDGLKNFPSIKDTIDKVTGVQRMEGSPGIGNFLSGSSSFNSMFENFGTGTLATLHGMEAVVRPEQLSGIINKATAQASAALPAMANQVTTASSQFSQINPEVFNEMKNQLAMLNSLMASHLPDISSTMTKQYSAMRDLSPDFHA